VLREWGFTWEMRWGFQLQAVSSAAAAARKRKASLTPTSSLNVNMGITVDYAAATGPFDSPLQCVTEARRHVLDSAEHQQARKISRVSVPPVQPAVTAEHCMTDCAYDSFDDCLHAAEHMDAVLSYYYADEKQTGAIKVVEIFPVHHHHHHPPVSDVTHSLVPDNTLSCPTDTNDTA